jgi:hypothetical protein
VEDRIAKEAHKIRQKREQLLKQQQEDEKQRQLEAEVKFPLTNLTP